MRKVYVLSEKEDDGYQVIFGIYSSKTKAEKARAYLMKKYQECKFEIKTEVLL